MTNGSPGTTANSGNAIHRNINRKINMGKGTLVALGLLGGAILMMLGPGCASSTPPAANPRTAGAGQPVPVAVATAQRRDFPVFLSGLGSVTAFNTVSVKSRVDGQLVQVAFKEGQNIKRGNLLAVIDPRPFEVQLSQAQATLFKDQAQLKDAQLNYQRFKDLLQESGAMSQQQVDTQQAQVNQLEGTVRSDQAQIDNAKLQIAYCHITAPVDGRIGLRLVDIGNIVHATDPGPMLVITQLQPISVLFTLPEDSLPSVSQHLKQAPLTAEAYSRDNQTKLATGTLLTIDNEIDQTTGTGKLKATFNNKDNALWPNQFVNVRLLLETRKDATVIPAAAIQRGPQGTFVFAVKPDNSVEVRPVTIALSQENLAVVSSGVAADDVVVTDGQDKLQAGTKVDPRPAGAPGNRPAGSNSGNAGNNAAGGPGTQ